ncbi:MAG: acyltransferase family protein [Acidimicrobiales bacterium]
MPFIASIDGLRAIAVVAVLFYHAEVAWLPGGFLGVEVFFVVSGYLITALLLGEIDRTGRVDLKDFWTRRARRLLPALAFYLLGSLVLALAIADDVVDDWFDGSWAAVFYVANWYAVFNDISYTDAFGRPSFLHHLWSLAVEEQFYLVWPLLMLGGLRYLGRRRMIMAIGAGVVASTALMWLLYQPLEDPLRIYYGTDTRAAGLLVGAGLAFVWRPWEHPTQRPEIEQRRRLVALALTAVGLAGVIRAFIVYDLSPIEADPLFRGGFLVTSMSTAALIAGLVLARTTLSGALSGPVMRWLGSRSYGIYLWHWPIFMVTRARIDTDLDGVVLLVLRFALTFVVAEVSYQLVEQPLRRGLRRPGRSRAEAIGAMAMPAVLGSLALLAVFAVLVDVQRDGERADAAGTGTFAVETVDEVAVVVDGSGSAAIDPEVTDPATLDPAPGAAAADPAPSAEVEIPQGAEPPAVEDAVIPPSPNAGTTGQIGAEAEAEDTEPAPAPTAPQRVTFVGDSVMQGAAPRLRNLAETVQVDTLVGRQWWDAEPTLRAIGRDGGFGDAVVVHLGNNGPVNEAMFDSVMRRLSDVDRVLIVNVRVPVRWESDVNEALAAGVRRWDNAVLVDWHGLSNGRPEFFAGDGVHLEAEGQRAYTRAIRRALSS